MKSVMTCVPALAAALLLAAGAAQAQPPAATAKIDHCLISVVDEADVPAQEPGVLREIKVKEGREVSSGDLLAQIDDAKTQMEVRVAKAKLAVAKEKAGDDISVRYAKASADVAEADYRGDADANRKTPGSVPAEELREKLMKYTEAKLSIEKARLELRIADQEANAAKADVDAAEENVRRHQVHAPQDGIVDKVHRHVGEWVREGDPVLHVIRMDRLRVDGFISAAKYRPGDFIDGAAQIRVALAGERPGKPRTFSGKVVFVDPNDHAGGVFLVRVEVENEKENGSWLLRPGQGAEMTITLK
jgi:multidrug resistance efflux pump